MAKVQGLVAKVNGRHCVVITADGQFIKGTAAPGLKIGQETEITPVTMPWRKLSVAIVAVLLLSLVLPFTAFKPALAQPVAFISVDINPSLELGVDGKGSVVEVRTFNPEAEHLLGSLALTKQNVYDAIQSVIDEAFRQGYISQSASNLVVAAYTGDAPFVFDRQKLESVVQDCLAKTSAKTEFLITATTLEEHKQAREKQLSQGKLAIYKAAKDMGKDINLEDLKANGIKQGLLEKGVKVEDIAPAEVKNVQPGKQQGPDRDNDKHGKNNDEDSQRTRPEHKDNDKNKNSGAGISMNQAKR